MTAPDFPALVAAARERMDQAERDVARIRDDLAALPPSDYVYARSWADLTERVVRWGRDVLDRHRPRANQDGRPDACPECFGGISADNPDEDRPCGCWGLSDPICGTCAQDGTAARRYPQFWPCDDALAVLRARVPDLLDEDQR